MDYDKTTDRGYLPGRRHGLFFSWPVRQFIFGLAYPLLRVV